MKHTFRTAEQIQLFNLLTKLVDLGKISEMEKEILLAKSGLNKISHKRYNNGKNVVIDM